ncbi:MAG TPA: YbhB/YbcL family Raf kinase inhibitor-like protein [Bacteroidota bacterium]|nr:YbhB/YbcL family Raf kinase inhibitor-like protein [Bacteroidota bacterium]
MFRLECLSYNDQDMIPTKHCHPTVVGGRNVSPGFSWNDPPPETKSFILTIVDPHPVAKNWIHWIVVNIPATERRLVEGASRSKSLPAGARELINSFNEMGYGGPAPPRGSGKHPYVATLYAVNVDNLRVSLTAGLKQLNAALEGKVLAQASVTGYYERK